MLLKIKISLDASELIEKLSSPDIPRDGHTRLAMNDDTVFALTGKHFYDDQRQMYHGFRIINDTNCCLGEVIILVKKQ